MTFTLHPELIGTDTPKDYHRIHFDPVDVPAKRIVGLLACQRDPALRTLQTRVVSSQKAQIAQPPVSKGRAKQKKGKDTPAESTTPSEEAQAEEKGALWEVELEDTVIFPEGGGQPFDTGRLTLGAAEGQSEGFAFVIEGCLRRKLQSVHLVRVPPGKEGILDGAEGREVEVSVDWERRMDQMSIHTGQHLLSAILDVHAEGLPTLSWSMAPFPSLDLPYVELPRALTWAEAEEIERKCNDAIQKRTRVWVDVTKQEDGFVKTTSQGVRENRGIPEDYQDGVIRHVVIDDGIDKNACCGTQLSQLGQLGFLHIIPPSTPSTSSKPTQTQSRLYFTAGPRAIRYLQQTSRQLSLAAQAISVSRTELVPRIEKMDVQRKEVISREKDLRAELAKVIADNVVVPESGIVLLERSERSTHDFEFMGVVAMSVQGAKAVVMTSVNPGNPALVLVQSGDADLAKKLNEGIKEGIAKLEGGAGRYKGGGAKGRYMGKVEGKWGKEESGVVRRVVDEMMAA